MDLDQIIKFVVLFFALVYFMRKPKQKKPPVEAVKNKQMQERPLKKEVASQGIKYVPPPEVKRKVDLHEHQFQTAIEQRSFKTTLDARYADPYGQRTAVLDVGSQAHAPTYNVIGQQGNSKANRLLSTLRNKQEMVILQEIINPPKSLR